VAEPPLIAAGRASEILDIGDGRVLRRFKSGGNAAREALVMRHARLHGYPVPEVYDIEADSLALERVDGPTMLEALFADMSSLDEQARVLAELHEALHAIDAPEGLAAHGEGDRLLHLDLHPENVILSPLGPVVIDWANSRRGHAALDVALTWVICATSGGQVGLDFAASFLRHFDRAEVLRELLAAVAYRLADDNLLEEERVRVRALAAPGLPSERG
jgi:aminoglycoside phosphotransferase (APT) family kinase protein